MLKKFISYYKPYKLTVALLIIGSVTRSALELFFPYVVKLLLEQQLPLTDLPLLCKWAAGLFVLYLGSFGLNALVTYYAYTMASFMERDMRRDLFVHMQQLSFSFYDRNKTGQLLSRLTSDLSEISELASRGPIDTLVCSLSMLGTMAIMIWMNPFFGLLITLLLLGKTVHTVIISKKMKKTFFANRVAQGEMTARASESLNGVRLIKAFAGEENDLKQFMAKAEDYVAACRKSFKLRSYFFGSMGFFSNVINIAILVVGGIMINMQMLTFGDLVAFFLYVGAFLKPLMMLLGFSELLQRGMAGFRRFYQLMQEQPEIVDRPDAVECRDCQGYIRFENVSFAYADGRPVIKNLNLAVEKGETVAFVGATGAGKTTIASLLLRFYELEEGRIFLDGRDIREYTQRSLRRQIGLVQQDVFLFGDTVRYNIAYAKPEADAEEIEAAAKAAAADEFIDKLPKGYATEIGERGVKLSGGQKQRIAIARIFLKNPPIVVLDEATSALDNITEKQIQAELDHLAQGRTTLIIAHRMSTIRHADKIVVLREGAVAEQGTHEELMANKGVYYELYSKQ